MLASFDIEIFSPKKLITCINYSAFYFIKDVLLLFLPLAQLFIIKIQSVSFEFVPTLSPSQFRSSFKQTEKVFSANFPSFVSKLINHTVSIEQFIYYFYSFLLLCINATLILLLSLLPFNSTHINYFAKKERR